jgi:hypothetical protein
VTTADQPGQAKAAVEPDRSKRSCPACGEVLAVDAERCTRCGLALGEHQRCYQCHSIAAVEPSTEARFVCTVCGAVRIPIDDAQIARSTEQLGHLTRATAARSGEAIWRLVAIIVGAFGVFSVLVLWLAVTVAHPPAIASLVAGLAALVPFVFAGWAWLRSRGRAAEFRPAFERAWVVAARDIARARGGELDAAALAKVTGIGEREADQLLARMSAESLLTSTVTTEGSLKYTLLESGVIEPAKPLPAARG